METKVAKLQSHPAFAPQSRDYGAAGGWHPPSPRLRRGKRIWERSPRRPSFGALAETHSLLHRGGRGGGRGL